MAGGKKRELNTRLQDHERRIQGLEARTVQPPGGAAAAGEAEVESLDYLKVKEGEWNDKLGAYVQRLVYQGQNAIVFVDGRSRIAKQFKETPPFAPEFTARAAMLDALPLAQLRAHQKEAFRVEVGKAWAIYAAALESPGSADETATNRALELLDKAEKNHAARCRENTRSWVLLGALCGGLLAGAGVFSAGDGFLVDLTEGLTPRASAKSLLLGAMGAAVSMILRRWKKPVSLGTPPTMYFLEVLGRLFVGSAAGVVVVLAIHSDLLLVTLNTPAGAGLSAFAAGATERVMSSVIGRFEREVEGDARPAAPAARSSDQEAGGA